MPSVRSQPNDPNAREPGRARGGGRDKAFIALRDRFADGVARLVGLYGANPLLGRLYAVLLLSAQPMSLDDVTDAAGSAKSTASVALRNLEKYRLVHRHWRKSDRRTFYEARTDLAQMVGEWRELFLDRDLGLAGRILREAEEGLAGQDAEEAAKLSARLAALREALSRVGEALAGLPAGEAEAANVPALLPAPERLEIEAVAR